MPDVDFDEFFRRSYPRLVALGMSMARDRQVAQELAQESLLRAHDRWDEVRTYDSPIGWVRRVMSNLLIDQHRKATRERSALEHAASDAVVTQIVRRNEEDEPNWLGDRWEQWLAPLNDRQRIIATLYYAEDRSVEEIADSIGVATGTVKSSLSRIRRSVRRSIGDDEEMLS